MKQDLISIELGDSHYYFISEVLAIRIADYEAMSQEGKNDICAATTKFGEPIPKWSITHFEKTPEMDYFYGRRKIWPNRPSPYKRDITRLTSDIDPLYKKVRHLCDLVDVKGKLYLTFLPSVQEDEDFQILISYIKFTK